MRQAIEEQLKLIIEMCTGVGAMAPFPNPVVGQDQPTAKPSKSSNKREKRAQLGYRYIKIRKKNQ